MIVCVECGKLKSRKGIYCKACSYRHRTRPSGLTYVIKQVNKSWFKKGMMGESSLNWRGGKTKSHGYVQVYSPNHPHCNTRGYEYEHRLVMEQHLGRYLLPTEVIHHINHNKIDNRIENLLLFPSHSEHMKHEQRSKHAL